ncbi:MAG: MGMT family protein [Myxococcota bacterium]
MKAPNDFAAAVYALVKRIPRGQVATYSQVGTYLGSPGLARAVGNALRDLPRSLVDEVPWQRVLKSDGSLAVRGDVKRMPRQARLLKAEGVMLDARGRVPLEIYGWRGPRTPVASFTPPRRAPR